MKRNVISKKLFMPSAFFICQLWTCYMALAQSGPLLPLPVNGIVLPSSCDDTDCSSQAVGDPYVYSGECSIGVERFISRTSDMGGLANWNYNSGPENCDPPYNASWSSQYCHTKYCEMIRSLPQMGIQLVARAYQGAAYHEHQFYPEDPWYRVGYQLVKDINHAYDCAGMRRPVIQAFIGEVFNPAMFDAGIQYNQYIPTPLIEKYFEYYPEDLDDIDPDAPFPNMTFQQYYFVNGNLGQPKSTLNFRKERITTGGTQFAISKVEMRMWFLYQAITVIDFGYTSIHMGIYSNYADQSTFDPGYSKLHKLTNVFRQYAAERGSFVLLSGETPYANKDNGESAKLGGTDQLIFDFDSRAMRPREISSPQVNGDGVGCDGPISPGAAAIFNSTECAGTQFPAVVDPCTINSAGGSIGGIAPPLDGVGPSNCTYEQVPYIVHFDGFSGFNGSNAASPPATPPIPDNQVVSTLTWGYDDHRWFSTLTPECREKWLEYFYCNRRDFHGGHGYLLIPGIINITYTETYNGNNPIPPAKILISDNPSFINAVANMLEPKTPTISIHKVCTYPTDCVPVCQGIFAGPGKLWKIRGVYYRISIGNKDCSSMYSIHVKDPNGNWLPQSIGGEDYFVYPEIEGEYTIGVRQDNLSLPPETFGTQSVTKTHYMNTVCCGEILPVAECAKRWELTNECEIEDVQKYTYSFELSSTDATGTFSNIRQISDRCQIGAVTYLPNGSAQGVAYVYDKSNPKIEFIADFNQEGFNEVLVKEQVLPCGGSLIRSDSQNEYQKSDYMNLDWYVIPNPAENKIKLQGTNFSNVEIIAVSIYNALGRLILENDQSAAQGSGTLEYDISGWADGAYFVLIKTQNAYSWKKFLKQSR